MMTGRLTVALVLWAVGASTLATEAPATEPHRNPMNCRMEVKKTFRLANVLKRGLPVRVTCDGPETVDTLLGFAWGAKKQRYDWMIMHPGGAPGISFGRAVELTEAGTVMSRSYFTPRAARFLRRYPRTRIDVFLGVEREENIMSGVGGRIVTLVR